MFQKYDATEKVYVLSFVDNGLDEDSINLILQLVFLLPYLKHLDLRRNCFKQDSIKTIEDKLREIEGVTGVVRSQGQILNVHSGNQCRLTVDLSEQMPKDQITKEVDFSVQQELAHEDADPFLNSDQGKSEHPWTKTALKNQVSPPQAVPDPSSVDLSQNTSGPTVPVPVMGGPPVGLGGPGNLSALTKGKKGEAAPKAGARNDRVPGPPGRRSQARRKAAPPPALEEYVPSERVVDKWQANPLMRPASSSRQSRESSQRGMAKQHSRESSLRRSTANLTHSHPLSQVSCGIDRSSSMPSFQRPPRR
jgi:hypothetical protein